MPPIGEYVLGIDLGSNSLGWAIIATVDGEPHQLVRAGVRIFEAGMEGDLASGREESRNLKRRQMRLQRRQTWRRARRLTKIFGILQKLDLLPQERVSTPEQRQEFLNRLDDAIRSSAWFAEKASSGLYPEPQQTLPYILRSEATREKLDKHFLGRALYHLAQRRGFLSNRKQIAKKKDDDEGKVKEGIAELRQLMEAAGAVTLGDYFSRVSPFERRIRQRWTHRDMYEKEFEAIWSEQSKHHPETLTDAAKKELRHAIFFQRPLWFDRNTIGKCELEPGERRAPMHLLISQRFRLLDKVNNLRINGAPLPPKDRENLLSQLETKGDVTFKKLRKDLGLKDDEINLARGGEEKLTGNRTFQKFHGALGQRWLDMPTEERDRLVEYVFSFQKADKLAGAAQRKWGFDKETAQKLAEITLEPDHLSLSAQAVRKLLPLLEKGLTYAEARHELYRDSLQSLAPQELLPPVDRAQVLNDIRNPAVTRSLTELRKVVNTIIRAYGKPTQIRIELARDLKKSRKQRVAISENSRRNEKSRTKAADEIIRSQVGITRPKPDDIRKWLLAEECRWECPYSGKTITPKSLFGPEPQFDIEHIIPFSHSMDNSFQNLTLCYVAENRVAKGNKTPFQAYSGVADRFETILNRVRHFSGDRATIAAKLRRFSMNDDDLELFLTDFRERQLNDTAYATSTAARYIGLIFGGIIDAAGKRRVQATSGQATYFFRSLWKLNAILNDGATADGGRIEKSRDDHRHHAVDALVIGLTDAAMIKRLADAAQRAPAERHRRFASLEAPWHNFVDSVRAEIGKIIVSHRVSKKVSGALHEETIYSAPDAARKVAIRKPLSVLSKNEVEEIADSAVKALVQSKLSSGDPKKAFANAENLPFFATSDGRRIPIKRVRVLKAVPVFSLGKGEANRHVATESNHHLEIYAEVDQSGRENSWDADVVPMYEAAKRARSRTSRVIQTNHGPHAAFKFSLSSGEVIECDSRGSRELFVVRKMSQLSSGAITIGFAPLADARQAREMQTSRAWLWSSPDKLRERKARKVVVSPLGDISEAHD